MGNQYKTSLETKHYNIKYYIKETLIIIKESSIPNNKPASKTNHVGNGRFDR